MAVRPVAATVSLALPRDLTLPTIQEIYEGAFSIAKEFDLAIAGGDTTSWDKPLAIDVAVLAVPYDGIEPVTRSGAKIGDRIYVTGPLGGSRLGRHLAFRPRVVEGRELAGHFGSRLHAMMDISDGLSIDLWRMCQASGVGAQLVEELLEHAIHADANRLAESGDESALDHALSDGEDFELLLAVDGDVLASPWPLLAIGEITRDGFGWRRKSGTMEALTPRGYEH
jgi:thiamine-monophosphate kinase